MTPDGEECDSSSLLHRPHSSPTRIHSTQTSSHHPHTVPEASFNWFFTQSCDTVGSTPGHPHIGSASFLTSATQLTLTKLTRTDEPVSSRNSHRPQNDRFMSAKRYHNVFRSHPITTIDQNISRCPTQQIAASLHAFSTYHRSD